MGGAPQSGEEGPDGLHKVQVQLPAGDGEGTLQDVVGIGILQALPHCQHPAAASPCVLIEVQVELFWYCFAELVWCLLCGVACP